MANPSEKLQKILARAGFGSRRQIEVWLKEGRVQLNGRTAQLGDRATIDDAITLDGKPCRVATKKQKTRVLLYHKPTGRVCSRSDPEGRPTVFDYLPPIHGGRWISIGRLDFNTSGLLLFTNDGELANRLMHPRAAVEREYAVRVLGQLNEEMIKRCLSGVLLEDGKAHFTALSDAGGEGINHWYHVIVKEGRNRLVRRLFESQGVTVSRLIRIRFASIVLPRFLRLGAWMELSPEQIQELGL